MVKKNNKVKEDIPVEEVKEDIPVEEVKEEEEETSISKIITKEQVFKAMDEAKDKPVDLKVPSKYFADRDFDRAFHYRSQELKAKGFDATPIRDSEKGTLNFYFSKEKDEIVTIVDPKHGVKQVRRSQLK